MRLGCSGHCDIELPCLACRQHAIDDARVRVRDMKLVEERHAVALALAEWNGWLRARAAHTKGNDDA